MTGILPGPSSTQTIVAIGYKVGGPVLALLTMLVWAVPALALMTLLSFLSPLLGSVSISQNSLRYIGPMAVGFMVAAAYRIGRKVATDTFTFVLLLFGSLATYFIRQPWIYPLVLGLGGMASAIAAREKNLWNRVDMHAPWPYLIAFGCFAAGSIFLSLIWDNRIVRIFESFYRYGYLVIGGGQVVVPLMHSELVDVHHYMTSQEFLTGFGLVQGLPGPMFSFGAYAGAMATRNGGALFQLLGALTGGIAIFLPGLLLIYFVYPIWESLKRIRGIKVSLRGITAVAGGLIAAAAIILMQKSGFAIDNVMVVLLTAALLLTKKVPAPLIVLAAIAAGFIV